MKVLVTGAGGFAGRWLVRELAVAGHDVVMAPPRSELDLRDAKATREFVIGARPDAVAHLAAIAFAPDAARNPDEAMSVSVDGTASVFAATARLARPVPVLVSGSSEVYGAPHPKDLPLRETASLRAVRAYGRSKLEQERTATRLGREFGLPTVVTRSFNHTGPGQRHEFVVPALAARIIEAAALALPSVRAGNVDVRRDIGDVRDVVRAYRLLLELAARTRPATPLIVNVCTGQGVAIREVIAMLADAAHATVDVTVDPQLVREDDPPEIVGDPTLLRDLTGWRPEIPLASTLADVLEDARRSSATPT